MTITINAEQGLYVLPCGDGYSCLGFEIAYERTRALALEMKRKDLLPDAAKVGTLNGYAEYERALDAARAEHARTGRRYSCELTAQLVGLEGKRVEVVDCYGETRRFYVGKSTGFIPAHLEIARRNSSDGPAVSGAPFKSIRVIGSKS